MADVFTRYIDKRFIGALQKDLLFKNCLLPDIKNGRVFPAVRNGYICFYYCGSLLFKYTGAFKTHIKFATTPDDSSGNYVSEESFLGSDQTLLKSFKEDYDKIKTNCELYSKGSEAAGVAHLYKYSFVLNEEDVIVLDIEVSFESLDEDKNQDRIDILLYSKKSKQLKFVEAKLYSNREIRAKGTPRVIAQIKKYNERIEGGKTDEILSAYEHYLDIMRDLFDVTIENPTQVLPGVGLYIFGFDNDQKKGELQQKIQPKIAKHGVKCYAKGDPANIKIHALWNKVAKP